MTTLLSILVLAMGPLALPADGPALCAVPPGQVEMAFDPGVGEQAICIADCDPYTDVTCSGSSCSAVDRDCEAGERGHVECDGNYTYCPVCPPPPCTLAECRAGCSCPEGRSYCKNLTTCLCACMFPL